MKRLNCIDAYQYYILHLLGQTIKKLNRTVAKCSPTTTTGIIRMHTTKYYRGDWSEHFVIYHTD